MTVKTYIIATYTIAIEIRTVPYCMVRSMSIDIYNAGIDSIMLNTFYRIAFIHLTTHIIDCFLD